MISNISIVNKLIFFSFVLVCGVRGRTNRIVGGNEAPAHEYPWIVGLSKQGKLYCGGSLISHNYVMTAAHCTHFLEAGDIRVMIFVFSFYFIHRNINSGKKKIQKIIGILGWP